MFDVMLKTAFENGNELIVQMKGCGPDPFKGKILDLNANFFTLFHSANDGGVLWAFKQEDIGCIGLLVETPLGLNDLDLDSETRSPRFTPDSSSVALLEKPPCKHVEESPVKHPEGEEE
jgi:hypothetical protein